ncbi:hypothetical protein [Candidatus Leptofilum sp.]|uniref:hypothetical protein n=1 Tax=Candidatus Leptofilum sp. TaxID=3241576 RepID=UPI003B5911CB
MKHQTAEVSIGEQPIQHQSRPVSGGFVQLMGETFYKIAHYDQMPPFFMSLVSSSDHWLFISSTGGLTAGRTNAESALFPYETEDKITAHHELTGSKTIVRVARNGRSNLWEPFSSRYAGIYDIERHLYKNVYGNVLLFEEVNHDLQLRLRTAWRTGDCLGFIRTCWLQNDGAADCQIELLDGLQNLLPYGVTTRLQNTLSSLLHAYKRNELEPESGLGIFALSATLTDQAEPSESLKATVAWQVGLPQPTHLLCTDQVDQFRYGRSLTAEHDILGKPGSYLLSSSFTLAAGTVKAWHVVADVNQDSTAITQLIRFLHQDAAAITQQIEEDIAHGTALLINHVAAADGLQLSAQETTTAHHFANVLFNIMRGGIYANGYHIDRADLLAFVQVRNRPILHSQAAWFAALPEKMPINALYARAAAADSADLIRLCYEYLPLTFSRRHGDPSRPWNQFSINLKKPDGSPHLDYQGNWRDIFQNWEPMAVAFPAYTEGVIAKFLNATTADGYNPYRVTRNGIEWESPEPDNPWSNIGYWSDHQIIYLQKLLEICEQNQPGALARQWNQPVFATVDVPYRLKPYEEMLADWYNTIDFDWKADERSETAVAQMGTDGRLHRDANGAVIHVTMVEKLLVLLLAKLTNLVPEGGIWMNTQRPEWNDANNALVGKGLSVVTVAYLRRFIAFWQTLLTNYEGGDFALNTAVATLFTKVHSIFQTHQHHLETGFSAQARRVLMDELGTAVTQYRAEIYQSGIPTAKTHIEPATLSEFLALAQAYIEQTLHTNWRADGLAHTYNILRLDDHGAAVENLYLMLEGQVAMLSSGLLTPEKALALLHSLPQSDLYRADQHSYMLYPNRKLPGFLQKNNVSAEQVAGSSLVQALVAAGDVRLLSQDEAGVFHFNGRFRNVKGVSEVLDNLAQEPAYAELVAKERNFILELFETTFNHRAFTGRSGTFFGFEGLGSIYWHMVSKLLLAAQECYEQAMEGGAEKSVTDALVAAYYDIRSGIGFNKTPDVYGAFPTDPYSHSPLGSGARQPGMTGQVKEEIMTRWGELGVKMKQGLLCFAPSLLRADEFLPRDSEFNYVNSAGETKTLSVAAGSLAFTMCQIPIVYKPGDKAQIDVLFANGRSATFLGSCLDDKTTQHILNRDGQIKQLIVTVSG